MCRFFVLISFFFLGPIHSEAQKVQWMSFEEAIEAQKKEQKKKDKKTSFTFVFWLSFLFLLFPRFFVSVFL